MASQRSSPRANPSSLLPPRSHAPAAGSGHRRPPSHQPHPSACHSGNRRPDTAFYAPIGSASHPMVFSRSAAVEDAPLPGRSRPASVDLEDDKGDWVQVVNRRRLRNQGAREPAALPTHSRGVSVATNLERVPRWLAGRRFKCLGLGHLKALFGTRVLVGISGDNPLKYWVKPLSSPNPHKTLPTIR
jgi:hypothetical protein